MDKDTAQHVEFVLTKTKLPIESFYFGLLVANRTVVAVFKSNSRIEVAPADINCLIYYMTEHQSRLKKRAPCFANMCVPGLTEEFKMSVFFHVSNRIPNKDALKLIIVTEEANYSMCEQFERTAK